MKCTPTHSTAEVRLPLSHRRSMDIIMSRDEATAAAKAGGRDPTPLLIAIGCALAHSRWSQAPRPRTARPSRLLLSTAEPSLTGALPPLFLS